MKKLVYFFLSCNFHITTVKHKSIHININFENELQVKIKRYKFRSL